MSKETNSARTTLSSVLGFMNQPIKSRKDNDVKVIKKAQKVEIVKEDYQPLEADSYLVDEISFEEFDSHKIQIEQEGVENANTGK